MLPTQYPYGGIPTESTPTLLSIGQPSLNLHIVPGAGLNIQTQLAQSFPQVSQAFNPVNALLPLVYTAGVTPNPQLSGLGLLTNQLPFNVLNSLAYLQSSTLCQPVEQIKTNHPTALDEPSCDNAHTIVRAPVLYRKNTSTDSAAVSSTGTTTVSTGQSPPDRIVASYAMAAHAAALANHQPVSKAAEAFLSATNVGGTRSRTGKRHRSLLSSTSGGQTAPRPSASGTLTSAKPSLATSSCGGDGGGSERRSGWSRVVDKAAGCVTYISPDGTQLKNKEQVYTYFRLAYPYLTDRVVYRDLIESCFLFSPSATAPMLENDFDLLSVLQPTTSLPSSATGCGPTTEFLSTGKTSVSSQAESLLVTCANKPSETVCRISFNPNVVSSTSLDSIKRQRLSALSGVSATETENQWQQLPSVEPAVNGSASTAPVGDSETPPVVSADLASTSASTVAVVSPVTASLCSEVPAPLPDTGSPAVTTVEGEEVTVSERKETDSGPGEAITSETVSSAMSLSATGDVSSPGTSRGGEHDHIATTDGLETLVSTAAAQLSPTGTTASDLQGGEVVASGGSPGGFTKMTTETLTTAALSQLIPHASSSVTAGVGNQVLSADPIADQVGMSDQFNSLAAFSQLLTNSRLAQQQQQQQHRQHQQQQMATAVLSMMAANRGLGVGVGLPQSAMLAAQPQLVIGGAPINYGTAAGWLQGAPAPMPIAWPADMSVASSSAALQHHHQQQQLLAAALLHQQQQQSQMAGSVLQNLALLQQRQQQQQLAFITSPQTPQSPVSLAQLQSYLSVLQQQQQFAPR